jgi:hypothetical protein
MDLRPLVTHLESVARSRPNAQARVQVVEALSSKWDSIQVLAVKALCTWGDQESIDSAKAAIVRLAAKDSRWASAGAMGLAIAPHLRSSDAPWIIDTLSRRAHPDNIPSLRVLTDTPARSELLAMLHQAVQQEANQRRRTALAQVFQYAKNRHATPEV